MRPSIFSLKIHRPQTYQSCLKIADFWIIIISLNENICILTNIHEILLLHLENLISSSKLNKVAFFY
uniref:Putative ovule protein n=1 Tax=Solanum chacoense TaxID=4108 RepID=A0A0V0GHQ1_SOLCH